MKEKRWGREETLSKVVLVKEKVQRDEKLNTFLVKEKTRRDFKTKILQVKVET